MTKIKWKEYWCGHSRLIYNNSTQGVMILILRVGYKNHSYIRKIQENLIKSSLQTSLPYIPLQMVHASYCAPYPK